MSSKLASVLRPGCPQVVKALATAEIEAQQISDEAQEDSKATGAQDFDLQIENMSKVRPQYHQPAGLGAHSHIGDGNMEGHRAHCQPHGAFNTGPGEGPMCWVQGHCDCKEVTN